LEISNEYNLKELLFAAIKGSLHAGKVILEVYNAGNFQVKLKSDNSPLTQADKKAHKKIVSILKKTDLPILSEEGKEIPYKVREKWRYFWLVDPLDGTKEFIKRNGEFTVNIALIHKNKPILGVIYIPVIEELYFSLDKIGAYKINKITLAKVHRLNIDELINMGMQLPINQRKKKFTIVGSRSHMTKNTEEFIAKLQEKYGDVEMIFKGSSLKFCLMAEGLADIYPRFSPTMEWDTAAGHAIALGAGLKVIKHDKTNLLEYNKKNLLNPWFIVILNPYR